MNNLTDLQIKHSYISYGENGIATSLINPALSKAILYKRSVGFFSSSALVVLLEGILSLVKNQGKIQLIASPKLSADDIATIKAGYSNRHNIIQTMFTKEFEVMLDSLDDEKLKLLYELVSQNYLDIKIAITKGNGMYHDKLGIIEDFEGNAIAFYGSANESQSGYCDNYEKIRVARSWVGTEYESVKDEKDEFDRLWNNANPFVDVYEYTDCAKRKLLKAYNDRINTLKKKKPIELRDYQKDAIQAWVSNNYHGFFVMATGTGKTWTAIYSALELLKEKRALIVICAPYKHLVKQWDEDVKKVFPSARIILVSSENPVWNTQLNDAIIKEKYDHTTQIIVISTITSFYLKRFMSILSKSEQEKLLIVDEAHRFTRYSDAIHRFFSYMLGLSATPFSGKDKEKGTSLMNFFGGKVFDLPIEDALQKGFLVPYNYHPIYVRANKEEEELFKYYSKKIASCFKNNKLINKELLVKSLRARLRVISMAEDKQNSLETIISPLKKKDHFVVYCGDGKQFDNDTGEELRHIQSVKRVLSKEGFRVSQFTAKENMADRMKLVESFNKGDISALVAIRCLDEGINIPSIQSAIILSSNDDYREFVQRRGRILRVYKGKKMADIYDVIVLPSYDMDTWASIEFRRYFEYARLALNYDELQQDLYDNMAEYGLNIDDISSFEYEDIEGYGDE